MKRIGPFRLERALCRAGVALALILALGVAPAPAEVETPAVAAAQEDPEARAILLQMADFLAKAPAFSVTMRSGYDAIQEDGQRIEFGERRRVLLQRPSRLRVETERSDGDRGLLVFDGKEITAFKVDANVYARVPKTGTVDDVLVYLVRDLQITMPLARMFLTGLPQDLEKKLTTIHYVEENVLFDVPTDHLTARSADVDLQIWIVQGEQPLPRRVILTYYNTPGQPQFRADLSDWQLSPPVVDDNFSFTPPEGAEQIPFLAPVRQKGSIPLQKGDAQ